MSKSAWGKIGAWADEAERADDEEIPPPPLPQPGFPSLKEASNNNKQKKKTKMTLQEFTKQVQRNDDVDILRQLPTAPKQRSPDEQNTHFSGYTNNNYSTRPGMSGYTQRSQQSRVSDSDRRQRFESQLLEPQQPSRADGVDNWASTKKLTPNPTPHASQPQSYHSDQGPPRRYGSLGGASRADEVDNWGSFKKPVSPIDRSDGNTGRAFGSGFSPSRPEPDRWVKDSDSEKIGKKEEENVNVSVNKPNPFGAARPREEVLAEKGLDWKKIDLEIEVKKEQEKEKRTSRPTSSHSSRPGSSQSSRSEVVSGGGGEVRQRPKVNPFGDARPREVLLEEKNLDWKKMDIELEHRRVDRTETEEEKKMKEEIEQLKNELLHEGNINLRDLILQKERDLEVLAQQLDDKVRYSQRVFERQTSGPVRSSGLSDRPPSRPGSSGFLDRTPSLPTPHGGYRAGYQNRPNSRPGAYEDPRGSYNERPRSRPGAYENPRVGLNERPHSRPGAYGEPSDEYPPQRSSFKHGTYQDPRAVDYNGRSHSRGTGSSWTRPDDRRASHGGGGGKGFSSSRDMDRSGTRW